MTDHGQSIETGRPESEYRVAARRWRQEAAERRFQEMGIAGYLERASRMNQAMERGHRDQGVLPVRMATEDINRLVTLTRVYPGSTIYDHIGAAVLYYSDQLIEDPQFIAQVEEQRRILDSIALPAREPRAD